MSADGLRVIKVWVCDECSYWRKEKSTGRHMTSGPDPSGWLIAHLLREAEFAEQASNILRGLPPLEPEGGDDG